MEAAQSTAQLIAELHEMSAGSVDDHQVLTRMLRQVVAAFNAVSGSLAVIDDDDAAQLVIQAGVDLPPSALGAVIRLGSGVLGEVAQTGQPRLLTGQRGGAEQRTQGTPASSICWPMKIKSRLIGALSINRTEGLPAFSELDVEHGATFVTVLALLVDNNRMGRQQQRRIASLSTLNRELQAVNERLNATQAQLLQSEKMASIGQLAAGVAHEINNPIGYVYANFNTLSGYATDLLAKARGDAGTGQLDLAYLAEDLPDLLRETREGLDRVTKIVRDLKDFSRVDTSDDPEWADLAAGLESTLNIVHNEIKYKATIERRMVALPPVWCRPSQINQVLMNLLVNAAQAIDERGVITLSSGLDDDGVWLAVADTGKGMTPEVRHRIFEPFFTTKPVGQGTGLGLSLSYSIMQKHGGRIEVDSQPGHGTVFRIWLPRSPAVAGTVTTQPPAEADHG